MKRIFLRTVFAAALLASAWPVFAQLCIQYTGGIYIEDFNTLAVIGTANTTVPMGWAYLENGAGANLTYSAADGSLSTGNTYSFGISANTDRAFGEITSSAVQTVLGMCVVNNTEVPMRAFTVTYTGELWRLGATANADRLDFQYSTNATSLINGTYIDVNALDLTTPNSSGTAGARDGNSAQNRTVFGPTRITLAAPVAPGGVLFLRWVPLALGTDDGLGIDDFQFDTDICTLDVDGNGVIDALTDGLMTIRAMFGLTGTAVTNNAIGAGAVRTTWTQIRLYLNAKCGTSFAP